MGINVINPFVSHYQKQVVRDRSTASGDVSYTGVGFKPKTIICFAPEDASWTGGSVGWSDGTTSVCLYVETNTQLVRADASLARITSNAPEGQKCLVKTLDADGFTLTWTKLGALAALAQNYYCICLR